MDSVCSFLLGGSISTGLVLPTRKQNQAVVHRYCTRADKICRPSKMGLAQVLSEWYILCISSHHMNAKFVNAKTAIQSSTQASLKRTRENKTRILMEVHMMQRLVPTTGDMIAMFAPIKLF